MAECKSGGHHVTCRCRRGYTGDGKNCQSACLSNNGGCHPRASCSVNEVILLSFLRHALLRWVQIFQVTTEVTYWMCYTLKETVIDLSERLSSVDSLNLLSSRPLLFIPFEEWCSYKEWNLIDMSVGYFTQKCLDLSAPLPLCHQYYYLLCPLKY